MTRLTYNRKDAQKEVDLSKGKLYNVLCVAIDRSEDERLLSEGLTKLLDF